MTHSLGLATALLLGLVSSVGYAADATFPLESSPVYRDVERVVTAYVGRRSSRTASAVRRHHVCVVGYERGGERWAWVLWSEGAKVVLWEEGRDLWTSRRELDVRTDFVADASELRGSTYRETQAWLMSLRADCAKRGRSLVVSPR